MKPRSAKAKGRRFQTEVRDLILESFPILEPDDVKSEMCEIKKHKNLLLYYL
jgi:hypothetical protein